MAKYPPLPFPDDAMANLIKNWVEDYPAIQKISICRGKKPIEYCLLFKPDPKASSAELQELRALIDHQEALSDILLRDIEEVCNINGVTFDIDPLNNTIFVISSGILPP